MLSDVVYLTKKQTIVVILLIILCLSGWVWMACDMMRVNNGMKIEQNYQERTQ